MKSTETLWGGLEGAILTTTVSQTETKDWLVFYQAKEDRAYIRAISSISCALFEELKRLNERNEFLEAEITGIEIVETS